MSYKSGVKALSIALFVFTIILNFAGFHHFSTNAERPSLDAKTGAAAGVASSPEIEFGKLPLSFEPNLGQSDEQVKFLSRGKGYALFLAAHEAVLALQKSEAKAAPAVLRMKLAGANQSPEIVGQNELAAKSNYFIGNQQEHWQKDISTFARVRYKNVYTGIDEVFYGDGQQLEYDFVVAPDADARQINLDFAGAEKLEISESGELLLTTGGERIRQPKPVIYQEVEGEKRFIAGNYRLNGEHGIGFELGPYDHSQPLTIDPVLVYSTFLGGNDADSGRAIAIDSERNVYVTGQTVSANFPVVNPSQANLNGTQSDVFVTKINAAGNAIVYSTFIGGSVGDIGYGIDVDDAGNAYVTGTTGGSISANNFPTINAFDSTYGGTDDAFLFKLIPAGNGLLYSTYLGGSNTDIGFEVKVNRSTGEDFIAGNSLSQAGYPTTPGAFNTTCSDCVSGAFVTKFNAQGSALVYSTFIGPGPANDLAIDASGNAYVVGNTISSTFPITPGAAQPTCTGCNLSRYDVFITKLNATGTALVYSTYLGGSIDDYGNSIAVDTAGNAYVTGRTESGSTASRPFPATPGAYRTTSAGIPDAFVTKVNPTGTAFVYSTYLGGSVIDEGYGIAVDPAGNAHLTGKTRSSDFPLLSPISTALTPGSDHVFIASLNSTGSALLFSTFFGGGRGFELVADNSGAIYVTGETFGNVPTMNAIQPNPGGGNSVLDAFVSKIQVQRLQAPKPFADFDGDRKADLSVFRPSNGNWYLLNTTTGLAVRQYGLSTDKIVPADYDGDGTADVAVFRPSEGNWYVKKSGGGASITNWGNASDRPVAADYDGDNKTDIAVWRESEGNFYIIDSATNTGRLESLGLAGDEPVAAAFVR